MQTAQAVVTLVLTGGLALLVLGIVAAMAMVAVGVVRAARALSSVLAQVQNLARDGGHMVTSWARTAQAVEGMAQDVQAAVREGSKLVLRLSFLESKLEERVARGLFLLLGLLEGAEAALRHMLAHEGSGDGSGLPREMDPVGEARTDAAGPQVQPMGTEGEVEVHVG
jgi:hypothetical protein